MVWSAVWYVAHSQFLPFTRRALPCLPLAIYSLIRTRTWQQPRQPRLLPPPQCTDTLSWTQSVPDSGTAPTLSRWRYRTARCSPLPCPPWPAAGPSWKGKASYQRAQCPLSPWIPRRKLPVIRPQYPPDRSPCPQRLARRKTRPTSFRAFSAWSVDSTQTKTGHGAGPPRIFFLFVFKSASYGCFVVLKRETHRHIEGDDITDPRRLMQGCCFFKEKLKPWTVGPFSFLKCTLFNNHLICIFLSLALLFFVKLNITRILSYEYRTSIETESLAWVWLTDLGEVAAVSCLLTLLYTRGVKCFFFSICTLIWFDLSAFTTVWPTFERLLYFVVALNSLKTLHAL